jgi:gliding motility-associated-like protein
MLDQNPIDSLFRDALREADVPAPDGVLQAVQSQLVAASVPAAAAGGMGLMTKASIWVLAAGSLATVVWWNTTSSESQVSTAAIVENIPTSPELSESETSNDEGAEQFVEPMAEVETTTSTIPARLGSDTVAYSERQLSLVPSVYENNPRNTPHSALLVSSVAATPSCIGSAQGRMSDLAGGCIQFESSSQAEAQALWRIDGELLNVNRGTHCPNFGQRDRISLVLILRHSTGCVDSQVFWVQAPKVEIPNYVIPDVITPNGDGLNDQFYVEFDRYPQRYELLIFDQLNRLVFRSEDPRENWKAQCYQTPCPAGLYRVVLTTQFEGQTEPKVNRQPLLIKK